MSPQRRTRPDTPWVVEIRRRADLTDPEGEEVRHSLLQAGFRVDAVRVHAVYFVTTDRPSSLKRLAHDLLLDPLVETVAISQSTPLPCRDADWDILRTYHPGVTDNTGETALAAAHAMGFREVRAITTGRRFLLRGRLSRQEAQTAAVKVLANPVIETVTVRSCR